MSVNQRLDKLEMSVKPPGLDLMGCWLEAHKQGLYCDMKTGEAITFRQLQERDPVRAKRLEGIKEIELWTHQH